MSNLFQVALMVGFAFAMPFAIVQTMRVEVAFDQTDRALDGARQWRTVANDALRQLEDSVRMAKQWQSVAVAHMETNVGLDNDLRVCRSMLTPQQRGEK